ncbi:MAG TPA: DegQ family serine endoprotease [Fibrobacteraceae bacterium]|nr:DegQ family serine endoprotease [Fibrobacteraceae bacterium]
MINHKKSVWIISCFFLLMGCSTGQAADNTKGHLAIGAPQPPALDPASQKVLGDFRNSIADMVDKVVPVIVSIQTEATVSQSDLSGQLDPFEFFFGPGFRSEGNQQQKRLPKQEGLGSGVIVSKEGYILTNNHVVEKADNITVTLADKREFKAKIIGTDPQTDVAIIQIEKAPKDLPVAFLGKSEKLRVGEWVVAVGNPFGLSRTVTTGIVSAKGVHNRGITSYENFIQTDAAINPGNSGGGLFNLAGELVGINTAILSRSGGFQGIGFAIPIDLARSVIDDLLQFGRVSRGWLGISIQDVDPKLAKAMQLDGAQGAVVSEVFPESPAAKAGLQASDVIVSVNGQPVRDANDLRNAVAMVKPGNKANLGILRDGKAMTLQVVTGSRDDSEVAAAEGESSVSNSKELGMEVAPLTDDLRKELGVSKEEGGVLVRSVTGNGPAAEAGLQPNDVLLQINRKSVKSVAGFEGILKQEKNSKSLLLLIKRNKGRFFLVLERNG